jgi:hypothetical protein
MVVLAVVVLAGLVALLAQEFLVKVLLVVLVYRQETSRAVAVVALVLLVVMAEQMVEMAVLVQPQAYLAVASPMLVGVAVTEAWEAVALVVAEAVVLEGQQQAQLALQAELQIWAVAQEAVMLLIKLLAVLA